MGEIVGTRSDGIVPVRQLKLSDAVASQLETLIRSGHFGAEGRMPSERELAEQFGVGRSSMREAISKLQTLGIISKAHGIGTFAVDVSEKSQKSISLLSAGNVTALELFEIRYALEPLAAEISAERRTSKDVQELKSILKNATNPHLSAEEFVKLDFEFHNLITSSTKNRLFQQLYSQLAPHHAIYSENVISLENRRERAHVGHIKILEAIEAQDSPLAKKEAFAHLRFAERDLVKEITKLGSKSSSKK
jgi:GntR family transcriptional repressor for pyruvate dehydrogenase complex